jgi:hypothetical protein
VDGRISVPVTPGELRLAQGTSDAPGPPRQY